MKLSRLGHLVAASIAGTLIVAPLASAAEGDVAFRSCISLTGVGCAGAAHLDEPWGIGLTSSGDFAYGSARASAAVHWMRRESDGDLVAEGCISETPLAGCVDGRALEYPRGVVVSRDDARVYVASEDSGGVAVLDRNTSTGALTQRAGTDGCITSDGTGGLCRNGRALGSAIGLVLSPDGGQLYVTGISGRIAVLNVQSDGSLTQDTDPTGCVSDDGKDEDGVNGSCTDGRSIGSSYLPVVSPLGEQLYVTNTAGALAVFDRNASTGDLTQKPGIAGCFVAAGPPPPGCQTESLLTSTPWSAQISPDGGSLYVGINAGLVVFARDLTDGSLTRVQCFSNPSTPECPTASGMSTQNFTIAVSQDSRDVVLNNWAFDGGLLLFRRNTTTGLLTQRPGTKGCITFDGSGGDCVASAVLGAQSLPVFGPGGTQLYTGSLARNSFVTFDRDVAPRCVDLSVSTAFNTAVPATFGCSDPNGDALTYQIAQNPTIGALGTIDQATATVFYNPFGGVQGPDSFKYRAVGAGVFSLPATVAVTVSGPPPPPPPPSIVPVDSDGDGSTDDKDCNPNNPAVHPGALDVPNNGVDEDCAGGDVVARLTTTINYSARRSRTYTQFTSLSARNTVPKGARIRLSCTGRGCPLKVKIITQTKTVKTVSLTKYMGRTVGTGKRRRFIPAKLRPKAKVEVRVTAANTIGRYRTFTVRSKALPSVKDGCLAATTSAKIGC